MITKLCTLKTACKMQTNASQNLQCNFISHNNQMNAFCMHFACIWLIVFQRVIIIPVIRNSLLHCKSWKSLGYNLFEYPNCYTVCYPVYIVLNSPTRTIYYTNDYEIYRNGPLPISNYSFY